MSMLPCARAARHQTFEKIQPPLVQGLVLLQGLHFLCATTFLTTPEMQVPSLEIRRHPNTASHASRMCLKDGDVHVRRAKRTGSFAPALPRYRRVRAFVARRRKYGEDTP
ncbi:hypothetical protein MRX96_051466 [Rhipicephalus microplus]